MALGGVVELEDLSVALGGFDCSADFLFVTALVLVLGMTGVADGVTSLVAGGADRAAFCGEASAFDWA